MQPYSEVVQDHSGTAAPGVKVLVKQGNTTATLFAANGTTPADNPLTTDGNGTLTFCAADGKYDLWVNDARTSLFIYNKTVQLFDPLSAATTAAVAGSVMRLDYVLEASTFALKSEAGIWSGATYAYYGLSKEFTAASVSGAGDGPLTTLFAFANNNGSPGDVVAVIGDAVARQATGSVFGGNLIARNAAGVNGAKLVGLEIDLEPAAGTTIAAGSAGLYLNVFNIATPAPAIQLGSVGGGTFANGLMVNGVAGAGVAAQTGASMAALIDATQGTYSKAPIVLGQGVGQSINLGGGNYGTSPFLYGDASGNALLDMGSGGLVALRDGAGTLRVTFDQFGTLNFPNNGLVKISGTQVLAQRSTGWTAMSGTSDQSTVFATSTVTLAQLAGRVMALQAALTSHGLIGA